MYSLFLSGCSSPSYRFWKLSRSPRAVVSATRCLDSLSRSITVPLEVTWPPPQTNSRVGGYDFLGGEAEVQCGSKSTLEATLYFLTFLGFLGLDDLSSVADLGPGHPAAFPWIWQVRVCCQGPRDHMRERERVITPPENIREPCRH